MFNSNIPLPDITGAKAKAKFLPAGGGTNYQLGYVVTVDIANLDPTKVPDKYKEKKTEQSKSGEWTSEPLKEVVYELYVSIKLRDKDGFRLIEIKGPKHDVFSGRSNVLQAVVEASISADLAKRTKVVVPKVNVEKCVSCD